MQIRPLLIIITTLTPSLCTAANRSIWKEATRSGHHSSSSSSSQTVQPGEKLPACSAGSMIASTLCRPLACCLTRFELGRYSCIESIASGSRAAPAGTNPCMTLASSRLHSETNQQGTATAVRDCTNGVQVSLKVVLPFLEGALRAAGEQQRNAAVVKSLCRAENLHLREEVTRCKQR